MKIKRKASYGLFVSGIVAGAALLLLFRQLRRTPRELHITTNDLNFPDASPEQLSREHLVDINTADWAELEGLGLSADALERLIENRPYRGKLELVSRMVLTEGDYEIVKHKVGVSRGREPVKAAVSTEMPGIVDTSRQSRIVG
jgi:hypothetical protein